MVSKISDSLPHVLAISSGAMTIVGGVDEAGNVFEKQVADPTGLISVWAPAVNILVPDPKEKIPDDPMANPGTSQAASIVVCDNRL